jgi:putative flippase GtrA
MLSAKTFLAISKFAFVGGVSFLIDFTTYYFLTESVGMDINLSKALAMILATIFNYKLNKSWTWQNKEKSNFSVSEISLSSVRVKFALLYSVSALINIGVNYVVLQKLPDNYWKFVSVKYLENGTQMIDYELFAIKTDKFLAFFCATLIGMVINFIGQKLWVFVKSEEAA